MNGVDLSMRRTSLVALLACVAACAHDERRPANVQAPEARASSVRAPAAPPQYLVADPGPRQTATIVDLGPSTLGLTVDRTRVVVGRGEPRVAVEQADAPLTFAFRLPERFGGGFLFTTEATVYRADTFDGVLHPVAHLPDPIQDVSFAPKSILVRTRNGERWSIGLPSGDRVAIQPLGAADVEALDDGRAIAFTDQGAVYTSTDHGARWTDVTSVVRSAPTGVRRIGGDVWLLESTGGALRLESDGRLSAFDKAPDEKPAEIRAKDPRWRGRDSPLRTAFRSGAAIDDSTAIVLEAGDLVRVDVHTGDIVSVLPGRAPPDAQCDAVPAGGDVLFACNARGSGGGFTSNQGSAFVVSHTTTGDSPILEQTFGGAGQFFASDDGGLAFAGPCSAGSAVSNPELAVCVRQLGGSWEELDLSTLTGDAGSAPSDLRVVRWIPRADGRVVAIVSEPSWAIVDPRTGSSTPLPPEARDLVERSGLPYSSVHRKRYIVRMGTPTVDATWTSVPGGFRGWVHQGGTVEVTEDGRVTRSGYAFEGIVGGAFAVARTKEGRLFQTSDHGGTWVEVAGPPGAMGIELRSCTTAGCDLGAFYRVGWNARPPRPEADVVHAAAAPSVKRAPKLELSCRPQGAAVAKGIASTTGDGQDLGLGATRMPVVPDGSDYSLVRSPLSRMINAVRDVPAVAEEPPPRAILSGYQAFREGDALVIQGPNKSVNAARRPIAYVPGFDPSGRVARTSFGLGDVFTAARTVGLTMDDLSEDVADTGNVILVTPADPNAISDIALANERGLVVVARNERVRIGIRQPQNDDRIISAVALDRDETAFLDVEASGVMHVFKIGPGGVQDLFDLNAASNDIEYSPANPDALAVNARGDLAILRTPSGSDPASSLDPAYVVTPSGSTTALAPWSDLLLADDPACKSDPGGWRTTLQVIAPWIAVTSPDLRVDPSPMLARVRWSPTRVCLEGLEARLPNVTVRVGPESHPVATYLVSKNGVFARVGIGEGVEWRQSLECSLKRP